MMKRFASHFVYFPGKGFLKRCVVEIQNGDAVRLFPLAGEVESTEWKPGVIVLVPEEEAVDAVAFDKPVLLDENPVEVRDILPCRVPYLFYPFDFIGMKPVAGTRRIRLR